jgi:secreted PhoX family phosphatase
VIEANRRRFLAATSAGFAALLAGCRTVGGAGANAALPGPLLPDPNGVLDLPEGYSYRVLSRLGETMSDGFTVPDRADGMGCFDIGNGKLALVRNHELAVQNDGGGVMGAAYDTVARSLIPLPGGTTTLVLDARTLAVERQYRSLAGTIRNCAGGITPWGSWLTCEEDVTRANGRVNRDHGYVFEVQAGARGLVDPVPLTAMGRFNHEAACVDPATGIVYLTEDREDGLFYRFLPTQPGQLADGGVLQALVVQGRGDTRGKNGVISLGVGEWHGCGWVTLDNPEAPEDDLRLRGAAAGAAMFARGEGIWMGEGELYFTATSGGAAVQGQVFRLRVGAHGPDALQLFFESSDQAQFSFGDNLTIAPSGHLVVCEDQYTPDAVNHLRGITPHGRVYPLGRSRLPTEMAGACFSPDGRTMFLNMYMPAMTLAISGPWHV